MRYSTAACRSSRVPCSHGELEQLAHPAWRASRAAHVGVQVDVVVVVHATLVMPPSADEGVRKVGCRGPAGAHGLVGLAHELRPASGRVNSRSPATQRVLTDLGGEQEGRADGR